MPYISGLSADNITSPRGQTEHFLFSWAADFSGKMSQCYIDKTAEAVFLQLFECIRFKEQGRYPRLDDRQKNMIRSSWAAYVQGDPTETGIQLFLRLFELYPRTKDKFDFARGTAAGQFQNNSRVIFHVTRVIKYLGIVVDNLDNLEDVVPILKQLGGRHGTHGYNIPQEYFPYLGRAMNDKMGSTVSSYNRSTEDAWNELFGWVTDQITAGQKEYTAEQAK